jgi:hypothetical protein
VGFRIVGPHFRSITLGFLLPARLLLATILPLGILARLLLLLPLRTSLPFRSSGLLLGCGLAASRFFLGLSGGCLSRLLFSLPFSILGCGLATGRFFSSLPCEILSRLLFSPSRALLLCSLATSRLLSSVSLCHARALLRSSLTSFFFACLPCGSLSLLLVCGLPTRPQLSFGNF